VNDELIRDIYERLGSMEAKIDDVRTIRDTAHSADKKADKALQKSESNTRDIENITSTMKWAIGLLTSAVVPMAIFILGQLFK